MVVQLAVGRAAHVRRPAATRRCDPSRHGRPPCRGACGRRPRERACSFGRCRRRPQESARPSPEPQRTDRRTRDRRSEYPGGGGCRRRRGRRGRDRRCPRRQVHGRATRRPASPPRRGFRRPRPWPALPGRRYRLPCRRSRARSRPSSRGGARAFDALRPPVRHRRRARQGGSPPRRPAAPRLGSAKRTTRATRQRIRARVRSSPGTPASNSAAMANRSPAVSQA